MHYMHMHYMHAYQQVIEVVYGGAAYRSKAVRVGDILLMADGGS